MKNIIKILEDRKAMLKGSMAEDKARYNCPFLGQFMRGRVAVEERWLEEIEDLIKIINMK